MNFKIVEKSTGYTKTEIISHKSATTAAKCLKKFIRRIERKSGHMIQVVRTDGDVFNLILGYCASSKGLLYYLGLTCNYSLKKQYRPLHSICSPQSILMMRLLHLG